MRPRGSVAKLVCGTGEALIVRDVGPPLYEVRKRPGGPPVKHNRWEVLDDAAARDLLARLRDLGCYDCRRLDEGGENAEGRDADA